MVKILSLLLDTVIDFGNFYFACVNTFVEPSLVFLDSCCIFCFYFEEYDITCHSGLGLPTYQVFYNF
jgi:hypothetical protein